MGIAMFAGTVGAVALLPALTLRFLLWMIANMLFRIRIEGADRIPRTGGALLVANHVSYADAVLVGMTTPRIPRFLMWAPYYNVRAARIFFQAFHAIPVQTGSAKTIVAALQTARSELQSGKLVAIFPEGSVTASGNIEPFTRGYSRIVDGTGKPIVPVHVEGMYGHPLSYKNGGLFRSWERLWRPRITVRVGEPIFDAISPEDLRQIVADLGGVRRQEAVSC
jgi:acyl-[acyl-carrier-protein]-phospholipid O-acyltransferase/long-chain-fatty-acid--[acyl-carrier-protein] ligase